MLFRGWLYARAYTLRANARQREAGFAIFSDYSTTFALFP
jgi:hypothetical protein